MVTTTANYGLTTGMQVDDLIEPGPHNRLAEVVDRVLGGFLKQMMAAGAYAGWELDLTGNVGAGAGLVGGCWCETVAAQEVTGLTAGAVNYIFAGVDGNSAPLGTVRFYAEVIGAPAPGAVWLGTMTVDAEGAVTATDSHLPGVARNCRRLEIGWAVGEGLAEDVAANATVTVAVEHEMGFAVPGAVAVTSEVEDFAWRVRDSHQAQGFTLEVTNNGAETADFAFTWERQGLVQ